MAGSFDCLFTMYGCMVYCILVLSNRRIVLKNEVAGLDCASFSAFLADTCHPI